MNNINSPTLISEKSGINLGEHMIEKDYGTGLKPSLF
jgi:hypothetical protein